MTRQGKKQKQKKNLDNMVSQEFEEKCFKKIMAVTVLNATKMLSIMRKEMSPLGLKMQFYSNDML